MEVFLKKELKNSKLGFTLMETLITLVIVGVIASLAIPTIITRLQKEATIERLKKTYSSLTQTNYKATADYGTIDNWFTSDVTDGTPNGAKIFANRYLVPYLQVSKNCELSSTGNCAEYNINYLNTGYANWVFDSERSRFYLNDGTLISISPYETANNRFSIYVDINGRAKPNTWGKDVFLFFYYSNGKFVPEGESNNRENIKNYPNWGCNKNAKGTFCASLILFDGWQMKDDYPW